MHTPAPFEQLFDHGYVTGILKLGVDGVLDQVEKGRQAGITGSFGRLFGSFGNLVQE
jgi:hypothetical protein